MYVKFPKKGDVIKFSTSKNGLFTVIKPVMEESELFDANLLEQTIETLISQGQKNFALDLSSIEYLYSDSINKFINLNHKVLNVYGRLALLGPDEEVSQILQRAGIQNFIQIYTNEHELKKASDEIIQQTSSINVESVASYTPEQQSPTSEFESLRSELNGGDVAPATGVGLRMQAPQPPKPRFTPPQPPQFTPPQQQAPQFNQPVAQPSQQPVQPQQAAPQQFAQTQQFNQQQPSLLPEFEKEKPAYTSEEERMDEFLGKKKSSPVPVILMILSFLIIIGVGVFLIVSKKNSTPVVTTKPATTVVPDKKTLDVPQDIKSDENTLEKPVKKKVEKPVVSNKPKPKPKRKVSKKAYKPKVKTAKSVVKATPKIEDKIVITSNPPGATVYFNHRKLGVTPYTWNDPSAYGMVSLSVEKNGYEKKTASFKYTGGTKTQHFAMVVKKAKVPDKPNVTPVATTTAKSEPKSQNAVTKVVAAKPVATPKPAGSPGTIFISSLPPMADVYMDGMKIGKTNIAELKVYSGTHKMKFVKGAKSLEKQMTFRPGKNSSQLVRLK